MAIMNKDFIEIIFNKGDKKIEKIRVQNKLC